MFGAFALYCLYTSKLFEVVKARLPEVHTYADDSQLYLSFSPDSDAIQADALLAMEKCIRDIKIWMAVDNVKLNEDRTEFLLIGSCQQFDHITIGKVFQ